jgi:hypothetical protein
VTTQVVSFHGIVAVAVPVTPPSLSNTRSNATGARMLVRSSLVAPTPHSSVSAIATGTSSKPSPTELDWTSTGESVVSIGSVGFSEPSNHQRVRS